MNPQNPQHIRRLVEAARWSRRQLEFFRQQRRHAIKQYCGAHYSENGAPDKVPVNLLKQAMQVFQRSLVAQAPRAMVSTTRPHLKPIAFAMETWTNHRMKEIKLVNVLRNVVLDALFSIGIVKTGVCYYRDDSMFSILHDRNEPFIDCVSLDDWVHDMNSKRLDQCGFMGHRFRAPLELVMQEPAYDKAVRETLTATEKTSFNEEGDERVESLSRNDQGMGEDDEYEDMVELWEIYLPRENRIVVLSSDDMGGGPDVKVLRVDEYVGPESGPYHILSFSEVPDNIMPSSPAMDLIDLHESINHLACKIMRQGEGQKFLLAVQGGATEEGEKFSRATDGTVVVTNNPAGVQEVSFGGYDQKNFGLMMQLRDWYSRQAGNLESLAGLSPQSETLGQDQLIQAGSAKQVQDMQARVAGFSEEVMQALAWYWWTDPVRTYEVELQLPNGGPKVPASIPPEYREGNWLELNFKIDPYSLQSESPSTRLQGLMNLLTQLMLPAAPMMQQQGLTINFEAVFRKLANYMNVPDLDEILVPAEPQPQPEQQELNEPPRMPQSTNRTYTRVNRPGATDQGKDAAMIQMAMGGGGNPGETAAIGRPTS